MNTKTTFEAVLKVNSAIEELEKAMQALRRIEAPTEAENMAMEDLKYISGVTLALVGVLRRSLK